MAIVWACPVPVESFLVRPRDEVVPRPDCPACGAAMVFWSGYERSIRVRGRCQRLWVRRARCPSCRVSHALVPSFCLVGRLDLVEVVGAALDAVLSAGRALAPVAKALDVPYTTARDWLRRFRQRAAMLGAGFASLVVEIGGVVPGLIPEPTSAAMGALEWLATAVEARGRSTGTGRWALASLVTSGALLAANSDPPWTLGGGRRWMAPVP